MIMILSVGSLSLRDRVTVARRRVYAIAARLPVVWTTFAATVTIYHRPLRTARADYYLLFASPTTTPYGFA